MRLSCKMGFAFVLAALLLVPYAHAASIPSEEAAVSLAESAMKKIAVDDVDGALELLRPHASIEWGQFNSLAKNVTDTYRTRPAGFGESLGYTYVARESHGDTLLRVTFIQKFKRKPLQWDFYFYKPEQEWLLWGLQFRASAAAMFNLVEPPMLPQGQQPVPR